MESKWGLIPDMSGSITLRELVRMDVAKELTMTGRIFDGNEAKELGLVTTLSDDPFETALKLANDITSNSPDAISFTKKLFHETYTNADEKKCLDVETKLQEKLISSWNQLVKSSSNFGLNLPFTNRKE